MGLDQAECLIAILKSLIVFLGTKKDFREIYQQTQLQTMGILFDWKLSLSDWS
jgi:hypothetical protein